MGFTGIVEMHEVIGKAEAMFFYLRLDKSGWSRFIGSFGLPEMHSSAGRRS